MKPAPAHHTPDIIQADEHPKSRHRTGFEHPQGANQISVEITKLHPRQMHQFIDRPWLHFALHRLTAPIAAFGEAVAPEEADAPRSGRNAQ